MLFPLQSKGSQSRMIRRTKVLKVTLIILCAIIIVSLFTINQTRKNSKLLRQHFNSSNPKTQINNSKSELFKILHLDLKGAPPKMKYLLEILLLAKKAGANGLLIEYEDMFPWSGPLRNISAGNAYTPQEVKDLLQLAVKLQMEVIPLVQTFGHLEFVLKLEEFRHLRELDPFPQEICPSRKETFHLVKEMVRQVMELHKGLRYLHIGCDEVYHLAACSICSQRNSRTVFTSHVRKMGNHIRSTYPDVIPIIWDDMLRGWSPIDIEESGLGDVVEIMVWVYIEDIPRLVPDIIWYVYKKTFHRVWGASAFKGAFGEKEVLPNLSRHFENNVAWQRLMHPFEAEKTVMQKEDFKGLVLTGWARYDHFAVLAELLPVGIPSLVLNLALADAYDRNLVSKAAEATAIKHTFDILHCPESFPFHTLEQMHSEKYHWIFGQCSYPGSILYQRLREYFVLQTRLDLIRNERESNGWVSDYNMHHNFSSPHRVLQLFSEEGFAAKKLLKALEKFKMDISNSLREFYDNFTVTEWVEQKIEPVERELKAMEVSFQNFLEMKVWPKRPFTSSGT